MSGPAYLPNPHDHPIWQELADALDAAMTKHPAMNSPHEGFAVLYEELIVELGEHVWHDTGRTAEARKEAIQVAAMGLRYVLDAFEEDLALGVAMERLRVALRAAPFTEPALDVERLAEAYHEVGLTINGDDPIDIPMEKCRYIARGILARLAESQP